MSVCRVSASCPTYQWDIYTAIGLVGIQAKRSSLLEAARHEEFNGARVFQIGYA